MHLQVASVRCVTLAIAAISLSLSPLSGLVSVVATASLQPSTRPRCIGVAFFVINNIRVVSYKYAASSL